MATDSDPPDRGKRTRDAIFRGLTGRPVPTEPGDLRGQLLAAFGLGRRGGPNTRAAAVALGVSQRTVQRWITTSGQERNRPSPGHGQALAKRARQAQTTKRGRAAALKAQAGDRASRRGAMITVVGVQGISTLRYRAVSLELEPELVNELRAAYVDGGDAGALTWLERGPYDGYVAGWEFQTVDEIDLRPL